MMEREEFRVIAARMRAVYSKDFMPDQIAFDTWYLLLHDLPTEVVQMAAHTYMQTKKFVPTPPDIREIAAEILKRPEEDITEAEAVNMAIRAARRGGYHAEEDFAAMPPIVQKAVGSPAQIRTWAMMDEETFQSVEMSHFRRCFRAEKERMQREAMTSAEVKGQTGKIRQEAGLEEKEVEKIEGSQGNAVADQLSEGEE